ncbi:MAG: peroxiredoxin [Rhodospirillales bacterium]|nr:peroxiredoxin [Rhodospirillales bacterium]MCW8861515.1 peroxiredoxin [Rhodospirillales bacterium]MCW8952064.1 peroxiredoxin [Rhodospirillales bacterium]MCW8971347.1 peroxiredoxin [Rhodospirillales bacterium]MCW9002133.1 peroxiredoxin [Rhodospirillales bacterium]
MSDDDLFIQGGGVLVTQPAPDFTAPTVMPDNSINEEFNLKEYLDGSYGLVFFYPLDFTFVCPSEILAFDHRMKRFEELNTKVVAVSVDSHFTHLAWKNTPVNKGGLGNVKFPMVADLTKSISWDYGVLINDAVALRGTFLIDKEGVVRHQVVNDLPLGRNVDEAIRMIEALQFHEENGEVCPAGWNKGDAGMNASPDGVAEYLSKHSEDL